MKERYDRLLAVLRFPRHGGAELVVVSGWFATTGAGLVLQSNRYGNTPAYGNLIEVLPASVWGCLHLVVAVGMLTTVTLPQIRGLTVAAITGAFALAGAWWCAFVIRWITDDGTTPVNPTNWLLVLIVLVRCAAGVEAIYDRRPHERD